MSDRGFERLVEVVEAWAAGTFDADCLHPDCTVRASHRVSPVSEDFEGMCDVHYAEFVEVAEWRVE